MHNLKVGEIFPLSIWRKKLHEVEKSVTKKYTFYNLSNFHKIFNIMGLMAASFLKGWMTFDFMHISVWQKIGC